MQHIASGGITRFLFGGNAFLYHLRHSEFEVLFDWMTAAPQDWWMIPSVGPSHGRLMDLTRLLRKHRFPAVMHLPCSDPRDAAGLEVGLREFAEASETKLILYLKEENSFGADKDAGLDAVARLVRDGVCVAIKYAVVRANPAEDTYLAALLERVKSKFVISGIGERPAVCHMRDWKLPGFTTGSGCIAPRPSQDIFEACSAGDFDKAQAIREKFIAHEDLRDQWGPAKVLHHAVELSGIAKTGPTPPFLSVLNAQQQEQIAPVARALAEANAAAMPQQPAVEPAVTAA
ncbi:MAG: dihydrodipicolinate synthase family protein [Verrucomicrobia bacterium]|nr:dihydrodipicolinate synthase family protein [Verrucomicrobiota bacterium]